MSLGLQLGAGRRIRWQTRGRGQACPSLRRVGARITPFWTLGLRAHAGLGRLRHRPGSSSGRQPSQIQSKSVTKQTRRNNTPRPEGPESRDAATSPPQCPASSRNLQDMRSNESIRSVPGNRATEGESPNTQGGGTGRRLQQLEMESAVAQ